MLGWKRGARLLPVFVFAAWACAETALAPRVDAKRYIEHIRYLASGELKGRNTGSPELEKAASYIAERFRALGAAPAAGTSYFQPFQVSVNAHLGPANSFRFEDGTASKTLQVGDEFSPFNLSASGTFSAGLVFAGYGITAPEYHYDDYAGIDANGKWVVVLRHEPQEFDENSVFAGRAMTQHAQFASKAINARLHGARGVILVSDIQAHGIGADTLEPFGRANGPADAGVAFVQVRWETVSAWSTAAGKDLREIAEQIDKDLKPRPFAFPDTLRVSAHIDVQRDTRTVNNVVAYIPGQSAEYIVLGAHYDHIGLGEQYSMAPSEAGKVHPGADDNASGVAGLLELARYYGSSKIKHKRGILFLAFAGEEIGLLGSAHYAAHPVLPLDNAVAMLNMDMIGRISEGKIYVGGFESGDSLKALVEGTVARQEHLKLNSPGASGYGASDHASFVARQVPVLFFFSGLHSDYHRPSDSSDKIESVEAARFLDLISEIVDKLSDADGRPRFLQPPAPARAAGGGQKVWFGMVPDFAENPNGVRLADTTAGSPAAKAGLRGGDIMTGFDGKTVKSLYEFNYVLQAKKPGDRVKVTVLREGKTVTTEVELGAR